MKNDFILKLLISSETGLNWEDDEGLLKKAIWIKIILP